MVANKNDVAQVQEESKEKAEKPEKKPVVIAYDQLPLDKVRRVRLGDLTSLVDSHIPGCKEAHRPIDRKNLQSLLTAKEDEVPPIDIQALTVDGKEMRVILSGHHRVQRKVCLALREFHMERGTWPVDPDGNPEIADINVFDTLLTVTGTDGKSYKRDLSNEERAVIDEVRISCKPTNYKNSVDCIRHAFRANLTLGKSADGAVRSRYGVWIYQEMHAQGHKKYTWRDAAQEAGVDHSSLIKYAQQKIRLTENQVGQELTVDTSMAEKAHDKEAQDARAGKALAKALRDMYTRLADDVTDARQCAVYLRSFFKDSDFEMLQAMASILDDVTEVEMPASEQAEEKAKKHKGV